MPCIRIANGFICGVSPIYRYKGFLFEVHPYLGPWPLRKDMQPRVSASVRFWKAFAQWHLLSKAEQESYRVDN